MPFVRQSFVAGETFIDLADAQRRAEVWCRERAGMRIHGTIQAKPAGAFALEEAPCLLPAPAAPYDVPHYATAKAHRDHHIEVAKALYSIPGNLVGTTVEVRADRKLVRVSSRGQLVKAPARPPAGAAPTPRTCPPSGPPTRLGDLDALRRIAAGHGPSIGAMADGILDHPLPWTKMRQADARLGLVKKWGPERVEAACARVLEAEAVNVGIVGRMLERGTENGASTAAAAPAPTGEVITPRFARDPDEFAPQRSTGTEGTQR